MLTSRTRNVSVPLGRYWGTESGSVPYLIVPRPWTMRISPTVPTIFHAVRCGASCLAMSSITRPMSGPSTNTLRKAAILQSIP